MKAKYLIYVFLFLICSGHIFGQRLVSVEKFGAIADAKKVGEVWIGTDNSKAINRCAAYCRAKGLTMFFPKGNYGVASTIWLTNPDSDGLKQASITVVGSNRGAFFSQNSASKICVLKDFKVGKMVKIRKKDGVFKKEPDLVPIIAINNGRQVHIEGLTIQGANQKDFVCGIAIGNYSMLTSIKNCSLDNIYAGLVFPGIRKSLNESVIEGNNDLLLVEQSTFRNAYNIVCAGTQPFVCEYRSNDFRCIKSIFTGNLMTNYNGFTRGSHKFSSNIFGTYLGAVNNLIVYFDLNINDVIIDSCHFETGGVRSMPEVVIRSSPMGGGDKSHQRISLTNNIINFQSKVNPSKYAPLIDTMTGTPMIVQGNAFHIASAVRIKAYGALFIGNTFKLKGEHDLNLNRDIHNLIKTNEGIRRGLYDFNHFIKKNSRVEVSLSGGIVLKKGLDYHVDFAKNAFEITEKGKQKIDKAGIEKVYIDYIANDAQIIKFEAWGGNRLNAPDGWKSRGLIFIGNKLIGKLDNGSYFAKEFKQ